MKIQQKSDKVPPAAPAPAKTGSLTFRQHLALWAFNAVLVVVIIKAQTTIEESKMPDSMRVIRVAGRSNVSIAPASTGPNTTEQPSVTVSWNKPIDCELLRQGDWTEIKRARHQSNLYQLPNYNDFIEMTSNCTRLVEQHDYEMTPLSKEEEEYPIAFAIRMHKNIFQVEQLLRTIYRPQNVYCIHVDLKSPVFVRRAMERLVNCFVNVFIASQLQYYVYESSSPVWADLQCMRDAIATKVQWKYFLNLPGQEFPLKTNLEMVRILKYLNGTNDVETYPFPTEYNHRIDYRHVILEDQVFLTSDSKPPFAHPVQMRKGNAYNSFSRAFVEWLLVNNVARDLYSWSNDTASPDELVWATLNTMPDVPGGYNISLVQTHHQFVSRFIEWSFTSTHCYQRHFVHQICIFSSGDLQHLVMRNEMFANKFDDGYDFIVLDCLEKQLKHRRKNPDPDKSINWDWIKNLPHIKDRLS